MTIQEIQRRYGVSFSEALGIQILRAGPEKPKNPHAVALGRQGGLARRGKPGRKLTSEEARRIRALRKTGPAPVKEELRENR